MNEETALVITEPPKQALTLFGASEPVEVIQKAAHIATALREVVERQGLISVISGKKYPRCEAWTLLGTMLGVFPVLQWSRPVEGGWEARVEARTRDGAIVGAAEAQCLKSEKNWANRDDFALRSMAQTRATAKALRMPLGFVMTLGGLEPTPAEEMTFEASKRPPERSTVAKPVSDPKTPPKPPVGTNKGHPIATEEQKTKFISLLQPVREAALQYAIDRAWILPAAEGLEDIPLSKVPTTQNQFQLIMDDIRRYVDGADQIPGAEASSEPLEDGRPKVVGVIKAISVKEGQSARGPWKRYGINIEEEWFNTFDRSLGEQAEGLKGQNVTLYFKKGAKGNDAEAIMEM